MCRIGNEGLNLRNRRSPKRCLFSRLVELTSLQNAAHPLEYQRTPIPSSPGPQKAALTTVLLYVLGSIPIQSSCWCDCMQITCWNSLRTNTSSQQIHILTIRMENHSSSPFFFFYPLGSIELSKTRQTPVRMITWVICCLWSCFKCIGSNYFRKEHTSDSSTSRHRSCTFNIEITSSEKSPSKF